MQCKYNNDYIHELTTKLAPELYRLIESAGISVSQALRSDAATIDWKIALLSDANSLELLSNQEILDFIDEILKQTDLTQSRILEYSWFQAVLVRMYNNDSALEEFNNILFAMQHAEIASYLVKNNLLAPMHSQALAGQFPRILIYLLEQGVSFDEKIILNLIETNPSVQFINSLNCLGAIPRAFTTGGYLAKARHWKNCNRELYDFLGEYLKAFPEYNERRINFTTLQTGYNDLEYAEICRLIQSAQIDENIIELIHDDNVMLARAVLEVISVEEFNRYKKELIDTASIRPWFLKDILENPKLKGLIDENELFELVNLNPLITRVLIEAKRFPIQLMNGVRIRNLFAKLRDFGEIGIAIQKDLVKSFSIIKSKLLKNGISKHHTERHLRDVLAFHGLDENVIQCLPKNEALALAAFPQIDEDLYWPNRNIINQAAINFSRFALKLIDLEWFRQLAGRNVIVELAKNKRLLKKIQQYPEFVSLPFEELLETTKITFELEPHKNKPEELLSKFKTSNGLLENLCAAEVTMTFNRLRLENFGATPKQFVIVLRSFSHIEANPDYAINLAAWFLAQDDQYSHEVAFHMYHYLHDEKNTCIDSHDALLFNIKTWKEVRNRFWKLFDEAAYTDPTTQAFIRNCQEALITVDSNDDLDNYYKRKSLLCLIEKEIKFIETSGEEIEPHFYARLRINLDEYFYLSLSQSLPEYLQDLDHTYYRRILRGSEHWERYCKLIPIAIKDLARTDQNKLQAIAGEVVEANTSTKYVLGHNFDFHSALKPLHLHLLLLLQHGNETETAIAKSGLSFFTDLLALTDFSAENVLGFMHQAKSADQYQFNKHDSFWSFGKTPSQKLLEQAEQEVKKLYRL